MGGVSAAGFPTIQLDVTEAVTIPQEIFLHQVDDRGEISDAYVSVCNLEDLHHTSALRDDVRKGEYYRKSSALVIFQSAKAASTGASDLEYSLNDLFSTFVKSYEVATLNDVVELSDG